MSAPHSKRTQRHRAMARRDYPHVVALYGVRKPKQGAKTAEVEAPKSPARRPLSRLEQAQAAVRRTRRPGAHLTRELLCAEHNVPNTGRQWVKLRKRLAREDRAQRGAR